MRSLVMYLVFDPAAFLGTAKNLLILALAVIGGYFIAAAAGFGRVQKALVVVASLVIAYMVIAGTLIQDAAKWAQSNGLG